MSWEPRQRRSKGKRGKPGLMHMKRMQLREIVSKQIVQGLVTLKKIPTEVNPADMFTKVVNKQIIEQFRKTLP